MAADDKQDRRADKGSAPPTRGLRAYFRQSKDPLNAVLLVLPLFVAYQLGSLLTPEVRNGVDFMTDLLKAGVAGVMRLLFGEVTEGGVLLGYIVLNLAVFLGFLIVVWALRRRGSFKPRLWPPLLAESAVYAVLFGSTVHLMMSAFGLEPLALLGEPQLAAGAKEYGRFTGLIISIGAGLYEEIVFRAGLLGGMYAGFKKLLGLGALPSAIIAIILSSIAFSAAHHLVGEPFAFSVFAYRFFAGVLLSAIFAVRGFAVAVYTHAFYDVIVLVLR